jgi:hypothetical protein
MRVNQPAHVVCQPTRSRMLGQRTVQANLFCAQCRPELGYLVAVLLVAYGFTEVMVRDVRACAVSACVRNLAEHNGGWNQTLHKRERAAGICRGPMRTSTRTLPTECLQTLWVTSSSLRRRSRRRSSGGSVLLNSPNFPR